MSGGLRPAEPKAGMLQVDERLTEKYAEDVATLEIRKELGLP